VLADTAELGDACEAASTQQLAWFQKDALHSPAEEFPLRNR
jgi:hypothetical protein